MVWYYADGDRQRGPISDEEFQDLVNNGRINSETLVWKDGMDNWQPLENAREAGLAATSPALPALPGISSPESTPASIPSNISVNNAGPSVPRTGSHPTCAQCGRTPLGAHDGVQLGNLLLCRNCDGELARHYQSGGQSLSSGYPAGTANAGTSHYNGIAAMAAGISSRIIAKVVDNLVQTVVFMVIVSLTVDFEAVADVTPKLSDSPEQILLGLQQLAVVLRPFMLGTLVFRVLYDSVLVGKFGATLGKMALSIRVVAGDGSQVRFSQAVIRAIAPALLQLPGIMVPESIIAQVAHFVFLFGYFIAIFDQQRRTLYDHIANTRVVQGR